MGVEFNEPAATGPRRAAAKPSFLEKIVFSLGLAKTSERAQLVLLVFGLVVLALAAYFFLQIPGEAPAPNPANYPYWPE